ncbi:MAG: pyridoxal-phosphate dependent enzyme [Myxococcota bacterium]
MKTPKSVGDRRTESGWMAVERNDALIGNTPLVRLNKVGGDTGAEIFVKMENTNPSGSIRDRYVTEIIARAVEAGQLLGGDSVALAGLDDSALAGAFVTSLLGIDLRVFAPEHSSRRLLALIERFGADIVWTNEEDGLNGAIERAASWARAGAERFYIDGFRREAVRDAYTEMADEILTALDGRMLGAFVTSVTTGGTLREVARELRDTHPALKVGGAVLTDVDFPDLEGHEYNVLERVGLEQAWRMRDEVAQKEGLMLGPKGAASVVLALQLRQTMPEDEVIVALNPDSGQRYLGWEDKALFEVTYDPESSR